MAQNAASQTGLDAGLLKKMLPILAMLVAGYMSKQHAAGSDGTQRAPAEGGLGGLLGGILGSVLGGAGASAPATAGAGGLASMLDMNGDGNSLDDIMRMAGKLMR